MNKRSQKEPLPDELRSLWEEETPLSEEITAALESIRSEPAPNVLKQRILRRNFSQETRSASRPLSWILAPVPAGFLALVVISLFSLSQYAVKAPGTGDSSGTPTHSAVTETELLVALFDSDLNEEFIFDVFADGFLSLEEHA